MNYHAIAFYQITPISDPHKEVITQKKFLEKLDAKARIYVSEEGINGQLSLSKEHTAIYTDWMHSRDEFATTSFKLHEWHEHAFPRLCVKYRKQLVALDKKVNFENRGEHISAAEFKKTLDNNEPHVLLDVRNDYEWAVGRFKGARLPDCNTFREFDNWADDLKKEVDPENTKVMMYCTGGIRCEFYSVLLKDAGFKNVFQLDGGVIQYGLSEGSEHWEGKLFVFDDRLTVPLNEEETPVIGKCLTCSTPSESYYNCANLNCNTLFLCCKECLVAQSGCCCTKCQESPVLRPFEAQNPHKPFRKKHHYFDTRNKEITEKKSQEVLEKA